MPRLSAEPEAKSAVKSRGSNPFEGLTLDELKPLVEGEALPEPEVKFTERISDKGTKVVTPKVIRAGEPRFFMERNQRGWVLLIGKYMDYNGSRQHSLRTLKPNSSNHPKDALDYAKLKKMGIPERFTSTRS